MSDSGAIDIATLGECMVELAASDGGLEHSGTFQRRFGGDTFNVAAIAAMMGARTAYVTALGTDPLARYRHPAL